MAAASTIAGFITRRELADLIGVSPKTVDRWSREGHIPAPVKIGARGVRWRANEIEAWRDHGCPNRRRWDAMRKAER